MAWFSFLEWDPEVEELCALRQTGNHLDEGYLLTDSYVFFVLFKSKVKIYVSK